MFLFLDNYDYMGGNILKSIKYDVREYQDLLVELKRPNNNIFLPRGNPCNIPR